LHNAPFDDNRLRNVFGLKKFSPEAFFMMEDLPLWPPFFLFDFYFLYATMKKVILNELLSQNIKKKIKSNKIKQ